MRILAVLLMVVVTITSFPLLPDEVQAAAVEQAWDGVSREIPQMDEDGTYLIGNGAELAWFADQVNSGMFGRNINPPSYLISAVFTVVFSVLVNAVMHQKLKKIDMVESLKSIE